MQPGDTPSTLAWYPQATADALPPMMLETDPRLSCQHLENPQESIISSSNHCPVYRYSNTLAYKPVCRKRETKFIVLAGNLSLPVVSRVGIVDDVSSLWYQKGAVMGLGEPLDVTSIPPAGRAGIARQMITLVTRLHEKGIIHGHMRPENFVKGPAEDECLRIVDFSAARMKDDNDLALCSPSVPSPEYASSDRRAADRPPSPSDDEYALAASIWAVFAGKRPKNDLFSSDAGKMPDLTKITDNELFCFVVDILAEGGLDVEHTGALSRQSTLGIDRSVSFPLSLFGADPDDSGEPAAVKPRPQVCAHCLDIAMADDQQPMLPKPQHLAGCQFAALSDYAVQWLHGQQRSAEPCAHAQVDLQHTRDSRAPSPAQQPRLHVDTNTGHLGVEAPAWSVTSNATSGTATATTGERIPGRERSTTVLRAIAPVKSESAAGHELKKWASDVTFPDTGSAFGPASVQRTMSHWSESSLESCGGDDAENVSEDGVDEVDLIRLEGIPSPLTPKTLKIERLQKTPSFETVALGGEEDGCADEIADSLEHACLNLNGNETATYR